jgi:hypothetical protein
MTDTFNDLAKSKKFLKLLIGIYVNSAVGLKVEHGLS